MKIDQMERTRKRYRRKDEGHSYDPPSASRRGINKMANEWRFNRTVHRAEGDRLVRVNALPVCGNENVIFNG